MQLKSNPADQLLYFFFSCVINMWRVSRYKLCELFPVGFVFQSEIFSTSQCINFFGELSYAGNSLAITAELSNHSGTLGLRDVFQEHDVSNKIVTTKFCEALSIVQASAYSDVTQTTTLPWGMIAKASYKSTMPMDEILLKIVKKYGEKILLKESDKMHKTSKKKGKKRSPTNEICKEKQLDKFDEWQGVSPWDPSVGGDGCPRFLCDVMVSIGIINVGCNHSEFLGY